MNIDINICEVGPRDGLQNEPSQLSVEDKLGFIDGLQKSGLKQIEVRSFVHPKAIPAMADTDLLMAGIKETNCDSQHLGLIMNERGLERAIKAGVDGVCIVTVVSETLCQKNNRRSSQEACDMAIKLIKEAKANDLYVRVDVAPAWVCPYEGVIPVERLLRFTDQIWEFSPDELALCDTIGAADPQSVSKLFEVLGDRYERSKLVAHFHDTQALGLANATAALFQGIRRFDASLGGLGGCPFAPGARGNIATEDLVHLCESMGFNTGIDLSQLWQTVDYMKVLVQRDIGGQSQRWWQSKGEAACKN
jgi:hydroxymethylglutaryl-CoA lyase